MPQAQVLPQPSTAPAAVVDDGSKPTIVPSKYRTRCELITPQRAVFLKSRNAINNRELVEANVQMFCDALIDGTFKTTPQSLIIDWNGRMLDGQHRIEAIIRTGISAVIEVTFDADPAIFDALDGGRKRQLFDRINLDASAWLNRRLVEITSAYIKCAFVRHANTPSPTLASETFASMSSSIRAAADVLRDRKIKRLSAAPVAAALATYYQVDPDKADEFGRGLATCIGLQEGSPMLALRNALPKYSGRMDLYWRTVAAMQAHREGRALRTVYEASTDFMGNVRTQLARKNSEVRRQGALSRYGTDE